MNNTVSAVIAAAGSGSRMKSSVNKQFLLLDGIPVLAHTLKVFQDAEVIDEIIIVASEKELLSIGELVDKYNITKVKEITKGGATRQESVKCGLEKISGSRVLIHDGARPFVTKDQIEEVAQKLLYCSAAAVGVKVKDTIKRVNKDNVIVETLDREELVQIQTPQGFVSNVIIDAHNRAEKEGILVTDDCALAEYMGIDVYVVEGSSRNIKITVPEDLEIGEAFLKGGKR